MIKKGIITTAIGIIAIIGLAYYAISSGGFNVSDAIMLLMAVGLIAAKDVNKSHSKGKVKFGDPLQGHPPGDDDDDD